MAIEALTTYRKKNKLTQKQLAARLGVSDVTLSRWETGKRWPRPRETERIAQITGIALGLLRGIPAEQLKRKYARVG